jgi:exodeoxyribonuclease V alpha subunit
MWTQHVKYGDQFRVLSVSSLAPQTSAAVFQFLSSGIFKGVGPAIAKRIVERFGTDTMKMFDEGVCRKCGVTSVSPMRRRSLARV